MATLSFDEFVKKAGGKAKDVQVSTPAPVVPVSQNQGFLQRTKEDLLRRGSNLKETWKAGQTGQDPLSTALQYGGQVAGAVTDVLGQVTKSATGAYVKTFNLEDDVEVLKQTGASLLQSPLGQEALSAIGQGMAAYTAFKQKHPTVAKDLEAVVNIASLLPTGKAAQLTVRGAKNLAETGVDAAKNLVETGVDVAKSVASKPTEFVVDTVENLSKKIARPDVSEATLVSLNPKEALKGTGQDIQVSVGGKMKKLSEITPTENTKLQISTEKSLGSFTKQAEKFAKDRAVEGGSPVEIVGNRVDKALDFADRKRQVVGKKMGELELKYKDDVIPVGDKPFKAFTEVVDLSEKPAYGVTGQNSAIAKKLVEDFDKLAENGLTLEERIKFVRSWSSDIEDAKDAFGKFKENASVWTKIQNAVVSLKDEGVEAVSLKDKTYRGLRQQYSTYKKLDEIGDMLLGKDGALGQRIKGAATVKRAIQSNSDAGARQFLTKLKELTGYDAIKEGDLALTAMKNVGDYQGLSLLNIVQEGKLGLINRALNFAQDKIVGNKATRVKNFIRK